MRSPLGMAMVLVCVGWLRDKRNPTGMPAERQLIHPAAGGSMRVSLCSGGASDKLCLRQCPRLLVLGNIVPRQFVACGEHCSLRRVVPPSFPKVWCPRPNLCGPSTSRELWTALSPLPPRIAPPDGGAHDMGRFAGRGSISGRSGTDLGPPVVDVGSTWVGFIWGHSGVDRNILVHH